MDKTISILAGTAIGTAIGLHLGIQLQIFLKLGEILVILETLQK